MKLATITRNREKHLEDRERIPEKGGEAWIHQEAKVYSLIWHSVEDKDSSENELSL